MIHLKQFIDPVYSSDRPLQFEPEAIERVEDTYYRLFPLRRYAVTHIVLKDGKNYWADGHHAAEIQDAIKAARAGRKKDD